MGIVLKCFRQGIAFCSAKIYPMQYVEKNNFMLFPFIFYFWFESLFPDEPIYKTPSLQRVNKVEITLLMDLLAI